MIIEELINSRLVFENSSVELKHAVEDILLRARKGNIPQLGLRDIAGEVGKIQPDMYIDPDDEEFKQTLINVLQQSDWVKYVNPTGSVILKDPEEILPNDDESGNEVEKQRDLQKSKVQRVAMKRVKDHV